VHHPGADHQRDSQCNTNPTRSTRRSKLHNKKHPSPWIGPGDHWRVPYIYNQCTTSTYKSTGRKALRWYWLRRTRNRCQTKRPQILPHHKDYLDTTTQPRSHPPPEWYTAPDNIRLHASRIKRDITQHAGDGISTPIRVCNNCTIFLQHSFKMEPDDGQW
jgi:hypothetical protein